jgi:hypothetical protein
VGWYATRALPENFSQGLVDAKFFLEHDQNCDENFGQTFVEYIVSFSVGPETIAVPDAQKTLARRPNDFNDSL